MKKNIILSFLICTTTYATKPHPTVLTPEKIATFLAVKKIVDSARETAEQLKNACDLPVAETIEIDPTTGQTNQGICLLERTYPRFLETPWGLVTLFKKAACKHPNCFDTPSKILFEKIGLSGESSERMPAWEYEPIDAYLEKTALNRNALLLMGEDLSMLHYNRSTYLKNNPGFRFSLTTVNGITQLPSSSVRPHSNYRSKEEILSEWSALEQIAQKRYAVSRPTSPSTASSSRSDSPAQDLLDSPFTPTASSKCSLM